VVKGAPMRGGRVLRCRVAERTDDVVVLVIEGELVDEEPIGSLEKALEEQYVDDGIHRIALDLREVRELDLEGIGMLLTLRREAERQGKRLVIRGATGQAQDKLRTTGVLRFLEETAVRPAAPATPSGPPRRWAPTEGGNVT
jgi:anti-anti-sigma factor